MSLYLDCNKTKDQFGSRYERVELLRKPYPNSCSIALARIRSGNSETPTISSYSPFSYCRKREGQEIRSFFPLHSFDESSDFFFFYFLTDIHLESSLAILSAIYLA